MEGTTVIDDTETTSDRWEGWHITSFELEGFAQSFQEDNEARDAFTKEDFEKALKKVSRKVKK